MDRQSPTSIHYSYSNSSNTSSFGISRSLEKSGNFNGYDDSSSHLNLHNSYNIRDHVIVQNTSESAKSSTIPELYLAEPDVNSSQRGTHTFYQSHQRHQINENPGSLSGMDRATHDYQIQELKMIIQQLQNQIQEQTIEKEKVNNKYERCLIQLQDFRVANLKLTEMLATTNNAQSYIQTLKISKQNEPEEHSRFDEKSRKQEDFKRLKNSLFVAQKQKNSYISINATLEAEKNQIQKQNIEYENQLAMLSQEIERQRFLNERSNNEKASLTRKNESLNEEIVNLKNQIFKLSELRGIESNENNAKYSEKLQQLFRELETSNRTKINLESENLRLSNDMRYQKQQLSSHIEKIKIEKSMVQRDLQESEERNIKFQKQIKFLQEKNYYSQTQISTILNQSSNIQVALKALQQKYVMLEREHLEYLHSQKFVLQQNEQLKLGGRHFEEQAKRSRNQFEKYQQEISQLRRKIQQISKNSQNKSAFLDENVRTKEMLIQNLENQMHKKSEYIRQLENKCRQFEYKIKSGEKERNIGKQQSEHKFKELLQTNKQLEMQLKEQFQIISNINTQNHTSETRNKSIITEVQNKNKILLSELQKLQQSHASIINHKNLQQSRLRSNFSSIENNIQQIRQEKTQIQSKHQETRQQNIKIYQQNNNLKNQINRFQKELQNLHQEYTTVYQKFTKLNEERTVIENESLFLKQAKLELENKNKILQGIIDKNQSQFLHNQQIRFDLENQLKAQISLNKEISQKLSKDASKQKEHFSAQISRKDAHLLELQQKVGEMKTIIAKLQMQMNDKERKNNELRQQAEGAYQKYNNAERQLDYLRENYKNLADELHMIKQTFASTQKINSQNNDQIMISLHQRERVVNEQREENKKLGQSLMNLRNEVSFIAQKNRNLEKQNKQYKSVTHILEIKSKQFENKCSQLQNKLRQTNQNTIAIEQKFLQIEKAYQDVLNQYKELQQNNNILIQNNSILEDKWKFTSTQNISNTQLLSQKLKILQDQYQQNQRQFQVIISQNNFKYQKLEQQYRQSIHSFGRLQEKFNQGEAQFRQFEIIHKNLESAYKEVQGRSRDWEIKTRQAYQKLVEYEAKITSNTFQVQQKQQKIQIYEHKIQQLEYQIQIGQQRYKQVDQHLSQIDQQKNRLSQNTDQLQQKLKILEQSNFRLTKQLAVSRTEVQKYQEQIPILQKQNTSMQIQLQQQSTSFFENSSLVEIKTRQMELQNQQFLEQIKAKTYRIQLLDAENTNLKQTINQVSSKYQTLQAEHNNTKKSLQSLKLKNHEMENKSVSLQQKLQSVHQHYCLLTENHKHLEQELIIQREIVHKTERQRFHVQETKENELVYLDAQLKDKQDLINRLQFDLQIKNNEIQSLNSNIQAKDRQRDSIANGSSLKIEQLQHEHQSIVKHYEHKISQMNVELETIHNMFNHEHNDLTQRLKQREVEYSNLSQDFASYRQAQEEKERQIKHTLSTKQYEIQEKQFSISNYIQKINSLTAQISGMGEKRMKQQKDIQEMVVAKNIRIQQLQKEIVRVEKHHRQQTYELRIEHENRNRVLIEKINELESTNFQFSTSLSNNTLNYQNLLQTLQTILQTNETYFQVVLNHLQQIVKANTQLPTIQTHQQWKEFQNKSINMLASIQQKVDQNQQYISLKLDEEQDRRITKERQQREQKHTGLQREQKIIEYLSKQNSSRSNLQSKFEQLVYNIKANTQNNHMDKVIRQMRNAIKQELNQAKSSRNQTILHQNAKYHENINNMTSRIFYKMQSLTSLLLENKEQQTEQLSSIKKNTQRLEKKNHQLLALIDSYQAREQEIKTNHLKEIQALMSKTAIQNEGKSAQVQEQGQLSNLSRQISILEAKLQRKNLEKQQMHNQYNLALTNFQNGTYEMKEQLEQVRKEKQRIMKEVKEKDIQIQRLTSNSKNTSKSGAYLNNRNTDEQIKQMQEKYDEKVVHFSQEISRLQKIISNQEDLINSINKNNLIKNPVSLQDSSWIEQLQKSLTEKCAELMSLKQAYESLKIQSHTHTLYNPQIDQLRSQLMFLQKENSNLQIQIQKSLTTIHTLTTKIETIKKSYNSVVQEITAIDNRVQGLHGKFNNEIIRKTTDQDNNIEITFTKLQNQNKELQDKIYEMQMKNLPQKQEYSKLESAFSVLKKENFALRRSNYQYQIEFQKVNFMHQKIGKLNFQVDRISQINIDLNQQVSEARFAIGDQATMERRLFQGTLIIVLLSAEIQSLRARINDENQSKNGSRTSSLQKQRRASSASKYSRAHHY